MKMLNVKKMGGAAKQAGFTIIELVVVILLLGILTATALPRFLDISDDAHAEVVNAHLGAFATGIALYRAAWFAKGKPSATAVDYEGDGVDATDAFASATGYPIGYTAGTGQFPETAADCVNVFNEMMQAGGTSLQASAVAGAEATTAANGEILPGALIANVWAGEEFATNILDANSTNDVSDVCEYTYTGQFNFLNSQPRVITYNPATGAVGVATSAVLKEDL